MQERGVVGCDAMECDSLGSVRQERPEPLQNRSTEAKRLFKTPEKDDGMEGETWMGGFGGHCILFKSYSMQLVTVNRVSRLISSSCRYVSCPSSHDVTKVVHRIVLYVSYIYKTVSMSSTGMFPKFASVTAQRYAPGQVSYWDCSSETVCVLVLRAHSSTFGSLLLFFILFCIDWFDLIRCSELFCSLFDVLIDRFGAFISNWNLLNFSFQTVFTPLWASSSSLKPTSWVVPSLQKTLNTMVAENFQKTWKFLR